MSDAERSPVGGRGEQDQDEGDHGAAARRALCEGREAMVRSDARAGIVHLYRAADLASPHDPSVAVSALLQLIAPSLASRRHQDAHAALVGARSHLPLVPKEDRELLGRLAAAGCAALAVAGGCSTDVVPLLEAAASSHELLWTPGDATSLLSAVAVSLVSRERTDLALQLLDGAVARWRAMGAVEALPLALATQAMAERRAGRPTRALPLAEEARELAEATGRHRALLFAHVELANAHSVAGDAERCRAAAAVVLTDPSAAPLHRTSARSALASVELWSGDPCAVIDLLEPLVVGRTPDPSVALFHQTLTAAYVQVGRRQDAEPLRQALFDVCPETPGRLRGAALTCDALLAGEDERDERFLAAIDGCGGQAVLRASARLQYARRLLADGCEPEAAAVLESLAAEEDENVLGLARSARRDLARLGLDGRAAGSPWLVRARAELHGASTSQPADAPSVEVQLIDGLAVRVDGQACPLPAGAASTAVSLVAIRGSVHVEELTDLLWPDAPPGVGRQRLRNVLSRVRAAVGDLLVREGDRVGLEDGVRVDHHVLEAQAREVLAMPPGPSRAAAAAAALAVDRGSFLPEALYEDWSEPARWRTEARRADLEALLES